MEELDIQQIRALQIEILNKVANFCDNNGFSYFLSGGTLLGAVRHRGYIPWDDDIDLMMPRQDYENFIKIFEIEGLKIYSHSVIEGYELPFLKISNDKTELIENFKNCYEIGVNIDIFPIDGFPNSPQKIKKHISKIMFYRNILFLKGVNIRKGRKFYKNLFSIVAKPIFYWSQHAS